MRKANAAGLGLMGMIMVLVGAGVLSLSSPAFAAECASDADCPRGLVCEVVRTSGCPPVGCPSGETCPPPEPCVVDEFRACVPGPCTGDADCSEGLVCLTETHQSCDTAGADCPEGMACPEPVAGECRTTTVSLCAPRYFAPCTTAADCGQGFTCNEVEECSCPGSPGSSMDGGEPAPEPDCSCTATGRFQCAVVPTACATTADCLRGWSCIDNPERPVCSGGPGDATCGVEPVTPDKVCLPPFWDMASGGRDSGSSSDESGAPVATGSASSGPGGESDSGCHVTAASSRLGGSAVSLTLGALAFGLVLRRRRRATKQLPTWSSGQK
jgi:hypothetical protein